jgi:Putative Actinobacterial Holin-X, holin superfamily III
VPPSWAASSSLPSCVAVPTDGRPENIATTLGEVADRTTVIVREEIELAKAEVVTKVTKLGKGAAVGAAAGVFLALAGIFFLHMVAWLLYAYVFDDVWLGYAVVVVVLALLAAVGGLVAYRFVKGGAPPKPEMAIEEAQRVKATVTGEPLEPEQR